MKSKKILSMLAQYHMTTRSCETRVWFEANSNLEPNECLDKWINENTNPELASVVLKLACKHMEPETIDKYVDLISKDEEASLSAYLYARCIYTETQELVLLSGIGANAGEVIGQRYHMMGGR